MEEDHKRKQPVLKMGGEADQPSPRLIRLAKRDINRKWRKFFTDRGIDPDQLGLDQDQLGLEVGRPGRPRKDAGISDNDGGDKHSVADAAMD